MEQETIKRSFRARVGNWIENGNGKIISRFPAETRQEAKDAWLQPRTWVRGDHVPEGHLTPWELLIFFFSSAFQSIGDGFNKQDFLYKEWFRIKPNQLTIAGVISSIWDAVNDPLFGTWMDRKNMGPKQWRTIMRISAITGNVFMMLKLLDGGLNSVQHIIVLVALNCMQDVIGTLDAVAGSKLRAGISPYSQERAKMQVWSGMGAQFIGYPLANIPNILMGLRAFVGFNDYQIIVIGSLIVLPLKIVAAYMISYIRQRVDFSMGIPMTRLQADENHAVPVGIADRNEDVLTPEELEAERLAAAEEKFKQELAERKAKLKAMSRAQRKEFLALEHEKRLEETGVAYAINPLTGEPQLSIAESFAVIKHNPYAIANIVAGFITVFTPSVDTLLIFRYLIPKFKLFGKRLGGEMVLWAKEQIVGIPVTFARPFLRQMVNAVGGPLRTHRLSAITNIIAWFLRFLVGYNTGGKIIFNIIMEMFTYVLGDMDGVAGTMMNYEMLDEVELKTGVRSEGVTMSIQALFGKLVNNNIGLATGNAFLQWTGYRGGYVDDNIPPPQRFMKLMWPMFTLSVVFDSAVWLIARSSFKHTPEHARQTEEELIVRRAEREARRLAAYAETQNTAE
ncbi:MAG: MFS transporter [Oscillospiraceae bacterium]|nr:MFS transporter [Oscillospiraceae bacterium]